MSVEIKSISGRVLYTATDATDVRGALVEAVKRGADLQGANLRYADLQHADLQGAVLRGADLRHALLRRADLQGADLRHALLRHADLRHARGVDPRLGNDLLMLLDQPGRIRAYKLVTADGYGPFQGGVKYEIGRTVEVENADTNPERECAPGVNVATLPWCMREWRSGYRILVVEFTAEDIAAIPVGDGKFRLHRATVVGEKDLVELGLVKPEEATKP